MRISHGLPCSCELITRFVHVLPIQLDDIEAFWKTLEIGECHPSVRQQDMDSEMCSFTDLLHQISTGPISKVREMRHLAKGVLNLVLPEDPSIRKSSDSGSGFYSGSGSGSGLGSGSSSRGRGRTPRAPTGRGRGRSHDRSSLSSVVDPSPSSTFPYKKRFPCFHLSFH
ncbi:hypothetical protein M9H77_16439 [Catharanthus roseus]|uniref:Uncharacterized protein n=1 Tax=Catharanthus roseus TaxID=4058 RepID=A0ACC0B1S8_CATRO|nr:hypothetical protein M9H77_16439 [Catharanthus roseus]